MSEVRQDLSFQKGEWVFCRRVTDKVHVHRWIDETPLTSEESVLVCGDCGSEEREARMPDAN